MVAVVLSKDSPLLCKISGNPATLNDKTLNSPSAHAKAAKNRLLRIDVESFIVCVLEIREVSPCLVSVEADITVYKEADSATAPNIVVAETPAGKVLTT